MKKMITFVITCLTSISAFCDTNDVVTVINRTDTVISAWLSGYKTTAPVIVEPHETKVLVSEDEWVFCVEMLVTAEITFNVKIDNTIYQKNVKRYYNDSCGFSRDKLLFIVNQDINGIEIQDVAIHRWD